MEQDTQHYPRTIEQLRIRHGIDELLFAVESLLGHAAQSSESDDTLHIFTSTPKFTQAVWKGDTVEEYHRTMLGISVFEDGLIVGLHPKEASEPRRHISVGINYANYSEYRPLRPGILETHLQNEQVTLFSQHFDNITAQLGIAHVISARKQA